MKKQLVVASLVMLGIFTISCGGKNENGKLENELKSEDVADCACNTLIDTTGYLKDKNYTGTCADKDQNDTIILKKEYKNGYLISEMTKQKVNGKYYITKEMTYDDGKELNGFEINTSEVGEAFYVEEYKLYKNGKITDKYHVNLSFGNSFKDGTDYTDVGKINAAWDIKNSEDLTFNDIDNVNEKSRPKSMPDSEPDWQYNSDDDWMLELLDKPTFEKVIKDLEKEFPKFFYVK